ncbi:MAG: phosphatidate cytidylyltransferase [Bacteroidaceae bacterium]|nr:phosphatidate cytidylyltransferase [Bacteroidaceae bacterium]
MNSLIVRGATGIVFVGLLLAAILYGYIPFGILFGIVTGLAVNEFCNIAGEYKKTTFSTLSAVLGGMYLFFVLFAVTHFNIERPLTLLLPYILLVVYMFVSELYRKEGGALDNFAYFTLSQVYAALPFALLNILSSYGSTNNEHYSYVLPLAIFIFLWSNDTGAYCTGCTIGRHKMFERISPKKTWEGFAGGAVTAIIAGYVMSLFFDVLNTWQWMAMAAIVVVAGTLGDLIESCMKREMKIKDSGNILPGHGGILDRFDSCILAVPSVIIFLYLL